MSSFTLGIAYFFLGKDVVRFDHDEQLLEEHEALVESE
jgi:hypothetical protein